MGLNGRVGNTGAGLQMLISKKESEESGERELLDGGSKRTCSLLNLAPTYRLWQVGLGLDDYGNKAIKKAEPNDPAFRFWQSNNEVFPLAIAL